MNAQRSVEVAEELDTPADYLWRTISDFEHIDRWTALKVRAIEGSGIGCKRTVEMESGALVTERLLVCDPVKRVFSYGIVPPNPYPMLDYSSTVIVEEISAQRSRLRWSGNYIPAEDADGCRTDNLLRKVYGSGIQLLREHFARS
jgi:Polyketide cyclase / dehydrase and lipid transport